MARFFGFALSDSMFQGDCVIRRKALTADEVKAMAEAGELLPCLNPSHRATIDAMQARYGIDIAIPETPPRVSIGVGDSVVVMGVRGLPRLTDRHEYSEEEIASATFSFSEYAVLEGTVYVVLQHEYWGVGEMPNSASSALVASFSRAVASAELARLQTEGFSDYNGINEVKLI